MSILLEHIKSKMSSVYALYVCMLCTIKCCKNSKQGKNFIKPLARLIANELDELSLYFENF